VASREAGALAAYPRCVRQTRVGVVGARSWGQLESDFRALRESGYAPRLDHQHGAAGEYWRLAGTPRPQGHSRFEALARLAGQKLLEVPAVAHESALAGERDPVLRWYRALRQLSGAYRNDLYATQTDGDGQDAGLILLAKIDDVCATSATLCITLESLAAVPHRSLEVLSGVPRYAGPYSHWQAAQEHLSAEDPDYAGAAREAVNAVEALCRILVGQPSATLGDCLKEIRRRGLMHAALAKSIEGLWGFASDEPGVRHGAATAPSVKAVEARYVVEASSACLVLLLSIDAGQG